MTETLEQLVDRAVAERSAEMRSSDRAFVCLGEDDKGHAIAREITLLIHQQWQRDEDPRLLPSMRLPDMDERCEVIRDDLRASWAGG